MKTNTLGVLLVALLAGGVVAFKVVRGGDTALAEPASATASPNRANTTSVVLVADPGEAESSCICGQIIRSVRAARTKGVTVTEVDPEQMPDVAAGYKARVNPTVLVLDATGREVRRFEGEDKATFAAIRTELDRLASPL